LALAGLAVTTAMWLFSVATWAAEPDPSVPQPPPTQDRPTGPVPTSPASPPATATSPEPARGPADDDRIVVRGAVSTRGSVENRVGIGMGLEMRSPLPWGLEGGPGVEVDILQTQRGSNMFSYLPIYWAIEYRPVKRFTNAFLSARLGWDLLGQEGDDTLASRNFYAFGVGLITRTDRPNPLQWELLYSRMRGSFPGVALSVGYRF
jgi:hypothetical protein